MIVVADTSPLNYLIRLGYPEILRLIETTIIVPPSVLAEMRHPNAPAVVRSWAAAPPPWVRRVAAESLDPSLPPELGAGEREAISLAGEINADTLLIDEMLGRREAVARQITVSGTLAVLLDASIAGHFRFPEELARLRHLGFRCSPALQVEMLARYEASRKVQ